MTVAALYQAKFRRTMPAGMPIRWRITGSSRATNTPMVPNWRDQVSAAAIFCGVMNTQGPKRSSSGRPRNRAAAYINAAPAQEPSVPAITSPGSVIEPVVTATCAAGGITTSDGSGTIELSMAISSATSQ